MPQRQNRMPGVNWSEYSTKPPRARRPRASGAAEGETTETQGSGFRPGHHILVHQPAPFVGPHSVSHAARGFPGSPTQKSRYYNPSNVSGSQFNRPEIHHAVQTGIRAHTRSMYFRRAGFGAALRYTLGMEQVPSHLQDYLNARMNPRNQGGQHVGPIYAHYRREQEGYTPSHESYYA